MLGIILLILKIILWVILGIIGLLLLLLTLVLWVPIRYQGTFSKYETIAAKAKVSYLLNFLRILVDFEDGNLKYRVKVLFFTVLEEGYEAEEVEGIDDQQSDDWDNVKSSGDQVSKEKEAVETDTDKSIPIKKEIKVVEEVTKAQVVKDTQDVKQVEEPKKIVQVQETKKIEEVKKVKEPVKSKKSEKKKSQSKTKKKKGQEDLEEESSLDKVKRFYRFLKMPENRGIFKFVLKIVGKILKSILPKRIEGELELGTDDPATTGYIVAVVCSFYHLYRKRFVLTPNFEEAKVEGYVKGRGRIIIGVIVFYAVRIILDKRVRRLIKEARK